jgi:hypothetical protein
MGPTMPPGQGPIFADAPHHPVARGSRPPQEEGREPPVDSHGVSVSTLVLGITEDSDPISVAAWQPFRQVPAGWILNADGHARGDGGPDLAFRPGSAWPVAVWAYNQGAHRDVAFSEWDGSAWTAIEFLTAGAGDDLDPRVFVEPDGTVHVAWWTASPPSGVFVRTRPAGAGAWDAPIQVSDGLIPARRPSVLIFDGVLRIAYERDASLPGMAQDVVVATRQAGGAFVFEVVASTARTERLDPLLHATAGHLWLDWKHAVADLGCAERVGSGWVLGPPEPWADPSWIGVEETRRLIGRHVAGP